mmetsp:Transcript_20928/g.27002  ORF Transcript_20928/g.27002 Transcript_20928/m.27002 type:complete len:87 (+) Transcript_20928:126-386(+)
MNSFLSGLKRKVGLTPTTRRASGTLLVNFGVATLIGIISGQYIFKDILREHFEELAMTEEGRKMLRPEVAEQIRAQRNALDRGKDS